ncbi:MAG TPA: (2Fe-2S)-binding protein [Sphingomicrobium sp.]|nr:(2Fe-2S)-binding protein [Sphingomicrobium sp.]
MTRMTVNGEPIHYLLDPQTPLLWALRDASNLTGTKHGCDSGDCGACTVIVDGRAVASCRTTIASLEGSEVVTIEGLSPNRTHPVQRAWAAEQVSQCGYCEPGFIMAIAALLQSSPSPSPEAIDAIPNICRCGAYPRIRKAIARAAASAASAAPAPAAPAQSKRLSNGSSGEEQFSTDRESSPQG